MGPRGLGWAVELTAFLSGVISSLRLPRPLLHARARVYEMPTTRTCGKSPTGNQ
jgi:hypothetical protein